MIRIVIADDHKLFGETLSDMLVTNSDFEVVALCGNSEEAIEIVRAEEPDIVLMDINMPPISGIEATKTISSFSKSRVIGLSMHAHPVYAKNMIRAGAKGYVTKNSSKEEIFSAVCEVKNGNRYICSEIKNMISDNLMDDDDEKPHAGLLTAREIQIIEFIRGGFSSKEIASSISVSPKTVEVHRHNILKKLKLKNSSSLVNFVYTNADYFL